MTDSWVLFLICTVGVWAYGQEARLHPWLQHYMSSHYLSCYSSLVNHVGSVYRPAESFYHMMLLSAVLKHKPPSSTSALTPVCLTPQSMALYWFSSSLVGFSHNLLLRSPVIHKFLKLQTQQSDSPYRDLLSAFIAKYCKWINSVFWGVEPGSPGLKWLNWGLLKMSI